MGDRTVLVADDSQTVQRVVALACDAEGIGVVAVADGDAAIARIGESAPDLIIADVTMPGRNGYEVAAFVRGRRDLQHIPVVLLAGMFDAADEVRAKQLGCAEVLVKPLKPQHLAARIRHWLESAPPPAPAEIPEIRESPPLPEALAAVPAGDPATEDYFTRLDAAFKTLGRSMAARPSMPAGSAPADADGHEVPTLQELLERLPQGMRTKLTPSAMTEMPEASTSSPVRAEVDVDAIAARVLEGLASRTDLLDEIARRVARLQHPDADR